MHLWGLAGRGIAPLTPWYSELYMDTIISMTVSNQLYQ